MDPLFFRTKTLHVTIPLPRRQTYNMLQTGFTDKALFLYLTLSPGIFQVMSFNSSPLIIRKNIGPRQANLVLITYANNEGSGSVQAVSQEEPSDRKPDLWPL